ncbi:MAG: GNAT family N-acetyltransferase [Solobacterium sp.]|nr:GNAT family N-acetyltransferase [Solobacterium sp.]
MMKYVLKTFDELTKEELYDIARHRQNVLIIGQGNIFHDLDGRDNECLHLSAYDDDGMVGYSRIMPSATGLHGDAGAFGRLSVLEEKRKRGIGSELVRRSVACLQDDLHEPKILISAMSYLEHFYNRLGFERVGDLYFIEGVEHINMIYTGRTAQ